MTPRMHQAGYEDSVSAELFQMCSALLDSLGLPLLKLAININTARSGFSEKNAIFFTFLKLNAIKKSHQSGEITVPKCTEASTHHIQQSRAIELNPRNSNE